MLLQDEALLTPDRDKSLKLAIDSQLRAYKDCLDVLVRIILERRAIAELYMTMLPLDRDNSTGNAINMVSFT
ncbi:hypothetical protein E4U55_005323, partial [Claviceps digitariae]